MTVFLGTIIYFLHTPFFSPFFCCVFFPQISVSVCISLSLWSFFFFFLSIWLLSSPPLFTQTFFFSHILSSECFVLIRCNQRGNSHSQNLIPTPHQSERLRLFSFLLWSSQIIDCKLDKGDSGRKLLADVCCKPKNC